MENLDYDYELVTNSTSYRCLVSVVVVWTCFNFCKIAIRCRSSSSSFSEMKSLSSPNLNGNCNLISGIAGDFREAAVVPATDEVALLEVIALERVDGLLITGICPDPILGILVERG